MELKKLEMSLKKKEELAEGLHLIDFEQLKIENSTLNEKIEERNEELNKLRKKTNQTVQVLTHIKEKLQFVQVCCALYLFLLCCFSLFFSLFSLLSFHYSNVESSVLNLFERLFISYVYCNTIYFSYLVCITIFVCV